MIAAGGDTPSVILTWSLSLLMNNRHVLKKAQEELELHVGKSRQVQVSDIKKLFYLQAIIKETLRLYPAQLSGSREFTKDYTINGYYIPKGTWLILNLWKIHRDPKIWADPLEFRPERFLTSHKYVDVNGLHYFDLIPFGAGRRACPGIEYSIQMLNFVHATLLQGFEISTPDNVLVDMTESAGLTNKKATPLDVLVAPRLAPTLYE